MGALGPVSEGLFAWLVGIGVLVGFAVWIAAHTARVTKKGERRMSDEHSNGDRAHRGATRSPTPASRPTCRARPTSTRAAEKRAERQVATLFGLSTVFTVLFFVSYFVFEVGDNPDTIGGLGASNVALGGFLGLALLLIGIGAIQWARKLMGDHEIVEMRHPSASSDEDRDEALAAFDAGVNESGIGRRPLIRNSLIGAMAALGLPADHLPARPRPAAGQQARAHGLEEGHAGRPGRHGHPDQARRHADRPAGQRRARRLLQGRPRRRADVPRAPSCSRPRPRPR